MTENTSPVKRIENSIDDLCLLWKKRKAVFIIVLVILIVPIVYGVYLQSIKIPSLNNSIQEKSKDLSNCNSKIAKLQREKDNAELKLAPFLAVATQNYPGVNDKQSLEKLLEKFNQLATEEKQAKMLSILERMECYYKTDYDQLKKKYPEGFYLFANNKYNMIPADKKSEAKYYMDWKNTEIKLMNDSIIHIKMSNFNYIPSNIEFINLNILIERKIGAVTSRIDFNDDISMFIELLDDNKDNIIYVIGFRKVDMVYKKYKLSENMKYWCDL